MLFKEVERKAKGREREEEECVWDGADEDKRGCP